MASYSNPYTTNTRVIVSWTNNRHLASSYKTIYTKSFWTKAPTSTTFILFVTTQSILVRWKCWQDKKRWIDLRRKMEEIWNILWGVRTRLGHWRFSTQISIDRRFMSNNSTIRYLGRHVQTYFFTKFRILITSWIKAPYTTFCLFSSKKAWKSFTIQATKMRLSPWKERNGGSKSIETILELPLRKAGALGSLLVRIFQECFGSWRGLLWPLSLGPVTWFLLTSQRKLCKYLTFFWGIQTGRFLITTNNETFLIK